MSENLNTVTISTSDDRTKLVLSISNSDGIALANASLDLDRIITLASGFAASLKNLPDFTETCIEDQIPIPIPRPEWRLLWLDTGHPVIAFKGADDLWQSFSMTPDEGRQLRDAISEKLG